MDDGQDRTTPLGSIFHFTEADLSYNRQGRLSAGQARRMLRSLILGVVVWPLLAGIGYLLIFGRSHLSPIYTAVFLSIAALIILTRPARAALKVWRDWRGGRVAHVEGVVTTHVIRDSTKFANQQQRYYSVAGQKFDVSQLASEMLNNGKLYRVYYAPHSNQVLALERKRGRPLQ